MSRAKKAKRDDRIVTYIRLSPKHHARVAQIAKKRGYPHTLASVMAELIARSLEIPTIEESRG